MPSLPPSARPPVESWPPTFVTHPAPGAAHPSAPTAPQHTGWPPQPHPNTSNRPPGWLATNQQSAAPAGNLSRKHWIDPPVTARTHAGLQRAAQIREAAREVIDSWLEPLGLKWDALSSDEQDAVRADASHVPPGLTAEETEPARLRAVFLRLEVPRHMDWLAKLPLRDDVLDPARFAPDALQARITSGDLSGAGTPQADAAYAVNALLGDVQVQPAAFAAPLAGQALEPEAVAAVLHAQGIDTHLFRHTVLGHPAGPAPLDPNQVALLDRLQTNRLLLQVRVGAACRHVVFLRVAEQWLRLEHGQLPQQDGLSPSAFLRQLEEAAGVYGFTALWPKYGLTAHAPQPVAARAEQPALRYDETALVLLATGKRRRQELQHFDFIASRHNLMAISERCGPTGDEPAVDGQGQPVAEVHVNRDVEYAGKRLPAVYRRIDKDGVLRDLRLLVPPGDNGAYSNEPKQILKEMQATKKKQENLRAAKEHARTTTPPRHCFTTRSRADFINLHGDEFVAAGYEARSFVSDIVAGQCESGEVLQMWKDGMLAVAIATPRGRATVLWQLENGNTASIRFVPPGQTPEEKRKDLERYVHGKNTAVGLKAHAWERQGLIEPLQRNFLPKIVKRRRDAFASMLGCKPEEVTPDTVRRVWSYCEATRFGQYVPSAKRHIGMLIHFTIPPAVSELERESHVLCRRREDGAVTDLLPFEADALAAAKKEIEGKAGRPLKRLREAEETDDEDYEDYYVDEAATTIPASMQFSWPVPGRTDPPQEERGIPPADWNP